MPFPPSDDVPAPGRSSMACAACGRPIAAPGGADAGPARCPECEEPLGAPTGASGNAPAAAAAAIAPTPRFPGPSPADATALAGLPPGVRDSAATVVSPAADPPGSPSTPPLSSAPAAGRAPARTGIGFGRYHLLARLGEGGMGIVWKAWDTELGRTVALKQLKPPAAGAEEAVARFVREAHLAATLRHPNIVAVFDVGCHDGVHFLTMEYIEGRTLAAYLAEKGPWAPRLRDGVRILNEVARAVGFAHDRGIIHRDLKPSNVLLDGTGRPCVMDFGLAKEVVARADDPGAATARALTLSGQLLGTPAYMSPEQVDGDPAKIGPRSDVWSLGVILYELLTDRLPFGIGPDLPTVWAVVQADPARPRGLEARVPADLESVCLKALEKGPKRRYATASELAADLERWLAGEPVAARRHTTVYRAWRWVARRRHVAWPLAAAALAVLVTFAWGWRARAAAGERARTLHALEDRTAQAVERFEDTVLRVEMSRAARDAQARQPLELLDTLIAENPDFGPTWSWRGRVDDLLGRREAAERDYDAGCARSPDEPIVWFLRAIHDLEAYARERGLPSSRSGPDGVEFVGLPPETAAQRARRERGLADLGRILGTPRPGARVRPDDLRLARGVAALHAGAAGGGAARAVADLEGVPGARAARLRGIALYYLKRFGPAAEAFGEALQAWPLDGLARRWRAFACLAGAASESAAGGDPRAALRAAIAAWDEAIAREPELAASYHARGTARLLLAECEAARGEDARAGYRAALADCDEAVRRDPAFADAYGSRGTLWLGVARAEGARGADVRDLLRRAVAEFDEAVRRTPGSAAAWDNRSLAVRKLADEEAARGADARPSYERALADEDEALRLEPGYAPALNGRGNARIGLARVEAAGGGDPRADCRKGLTACDEALRARPGWVAALKTRACAWLELGGAEAAAGGDPRDSLRKALADALEALRRGPADAESWLDCATIRLHVAQAEKERGGDPGETWRQGIGDCDEVLRSRPADARALATRANARLALGRAEAERGGDPRALLAQAITDYDAALHAAPDLSLAYNNRGLAHEELAVAEAARGGDARASFGRAEADYRAAAARRNPGAWANLALLCRRLGRFDDAVAAYEGAAREQPRDADWARAQIAEVRALQAGGGMPAGAGSSWAAELAAAGSAVEAGDYPAARGHYEKGFALLDGVLSGLAEAERARRLGDTGVRTLLTNAHYNLACILALASAGRTGPGSGAVGGVDPPRPALPPLAPEEAARLRDGAFRHLESAVTLGWKDRAHLEADPDLAPLRPDPRWGTLLARMAR